MTFVQERPTKQVLKDYVDKVKRRLEEKTGWGRVELSRMLDEELVQLLTEEDL